MSRENLYQDWTLFLDRDGVINERLPGQYVQYWSQFKFMPNALEAIAQFKDYFQHILVVTNQQGIGKDLMSRTDLESIHQEMCKQIQDHGGNIDAIYFCPKLASDPENCRKPAPKMALEAKAQFPEIDFKKAIMIGDSWSDIAFGCNLGMQTVLIEGKTEDQEKIETLLSEDPSFYLNHRFESLFDFATFLSK